MSEQTLPADPVTLANWQQPGQLRWSFQHLDEVLPVATIPRAAGPVGLVDAVGELGDLGAVEVTLADGAVRSVTEIVEATDTDAWMVLHGDRILAESYLGGMTPHTRHLLMSVSKSLVSSVLGVLVDRGVIDVEAPVTDYVPELAPSGYAGASVRTVLDMRSGIHFSEEYLDPQAEVRQLDAAVGWAPSLGPTSPRTLREFLISLWAERPHGGPFDYRSCEADVLGWVIEGATGRPFPEVASELLWGPLGTEADAFITVDAEGTGMFDGGICATLRDLARFGAMVVSGGVSLTGQRVLSQAWVDDIYAGGPDSAEACAAGPHADLMPGGMYRSQFWFPSASRDVAHCRGIHGQFVYLNRVTGVVGVKFSGWPLPLDDDKGNAAMAMFDAISDHVASQASSGGPETKE